jgi:glyoxylase-like metal-dependent hydrolase (beta-lactamase superfamily II)
VSAIPHWELYAIRYASAQRTVHGNFLHPDKLTDGPMRLDFFIWIAINSIDKRVVAVDTGFNRDSSQRRHRVQECDPTTALSALDIDIATVGDVIVTHLHYDHAGNFSEFPTATFHLQEDEMGYATGPCMCDHKQNHFFEVDDIGAAVRALYAGRLQFHRGDAEIAPGIFVHRIGGHTAGLQVVRVHTARGWVVLASDASHYFANKALRNPFPAIHDLDEMLRGFDRLDALADSPAHIVPGHDPEVLRIYPRRENSRGLDIVALHRAPLMAPAMSYHIQTRA